MVAHTWAAISPFRKGENLPPSFGKIGKMSENPHLHPPNGRKFGLPPKNFEKFYTPSIHSPNFFRKMTPLKIFQNLTPPLSHQSAHVWAKIYPFFTLLA